MLLNWQRELLNHPRRWLVTGAAGFIGSNLVETLLKHDQVVVGLDDFSTGSRWNLQDVENVVEPKQWQRFTFIEASIVDASACARACEHVDVVLHQAALGSVPRSINNPQATNAVNIDGFLNMLVAARDAGVQRFVYAASSSTYGDHPGLPKVEDAIGRPLSPYAVTKLVNELYADVFARTYGLQVVGLRYFNVFGKRQSPNGAYAAVIPRWIAAVLSHQAIEIYGDGLTSRDFCYVENAVQANLAAALVQNPDAFNQVYNVAVGDQTSLLQLFDYIKEYAQVKGCTYEESPTFKPFRTGDVRHSLADISKAHRLLGYTPTHRIRDGLHSTIDWYMSQQGREAGA